ncbi:hypothetical protein L2E82_40167 [Cichorium intybus]|uniref:Uncharacterized protein n=1 Tax=Cichorium intybus TaxID=13427 RepID=A0ACB9AJQ1_CICIN|nr:hypothetical protein L2E82_40167 [Cichorium intybus]
MLEKIGLPPKPSLRGNNWVIDATHCQGCSSQFTFINRKHHCRRCGGLFCGSCTQQRMYLRGQGDSPVRICEPCKTLEEAARFEMRYGHKNKSRKGASKLASDNDNDLLIKAEGDNGNQSISSNKDSVHSLPSASSSNVDMEFDLESTTPEELRQKAVEEKKKYKTLKAEGKPEEALRAFKRGKELERQAGTLEIESRKNRRKGLSSTSGNESTKGGNGKQPKQNDDLVSELKELGWSDHDLHDSDKKPVNMTLEGELSTLIKQVSQKSTKTEKGNSGIDKSEVIAIKKKALAYKREGKLAEAKEELKKAKILEKQIEERELLGDDSDSDGDDEFKSLIRSMGIDKQDILASGNDWNRNQNQNRNIDLDFDFDFDRNPDFEVTEEDMDDPEMSAALQSLGWTEDHSVNDDVAVVSEKIQSLKREALIKKRAGQTEEALELLKKARMLEKGESNDSGESSKLDSGPKVGSKTGPKNKLAIQRELLAIKKKALALRREGKADEADQELAKGKALEQQLEELETGPKVKPSVKPVDFSTPMEVEGEEGEEVTDTDMNDPSYLSLLQNLGWQEEEEEKEDVKVKVDLSTPKPKSKTEIQRELLALKRKSLALRREGNADEAEEVLKTTKGLEAQLAELEGPNTEKETVEEPEPDRTAVNKLEPGSVKERVMAHKRKALSLKREGKLAEAKEELKMAKILENKNHDVDMGDRTPGPPVGPVSSEPSGSNVVEPEVTDSSPPVKLSSRDRFKLQQESLKHKRQAMKLRREGRAEEAEAEFELAKNLESQLEAASEAVKPVGGGGDVGVEDLLDPQLLLALREVGIEGGGGVRLSPEKKVEVAAVVKKNEVVVKKSEREEVEEEIKAEKVKAVKLKRAGKQTEALDALRRAKLLEKKLTSLA